MAQCWLWKKSLGTHTSVVSFLAFFCSQEAESFSGKDRLAVHLSVRHLVSMAHDSFQKAYCSLSRIGVPTNTLGHSFQVIWVSVDKMILLNAFPNPWFGSKSCCGLQVLPSAANALKDLHEEKGQLSSTHTALSKSRQRKQLWWVPIMCQALYQALVMLYLIGFL